MKTLPTIRDVAQRTSLSISTVSLVLNNKPHVSDETRRKVQLAIEELGYHPRRSARGLASRESGNIGFILSDDHFTQAEPFYTKIFLGTEFEARHHHYYIVLTTVGKEFRGNETVPRFLLERNVDGVILAGRVPEKLVEYIGKLDLPLVLVDYSFRRKRISSVLIDNRKGVELATRHLIGGGHKRIAFIGGDIGHPSIAERFDSYRETLDEEGIPFNPGLVVTEERDTGIRNGFDAIAAVLRRGIKPSAVVAANDAMAIGCMRYAKAAGMRIPDDLAIVGFDDIEMSSLVEPRLTTVRVFKEQIGKLAVEQLVERIKLESDTVVTIHAPVELIVRESCGISDPGSPSPDAPEPVLEFSPREL